MAMLEKLIQGNVFLYAVWGIGLIGLVLQTIIAFILNSHVKASNHMVTTKKKIFKAIRQKNEDNKTLGIVTSDHDAFIDRYLYRIKAVGIPVLRAEQVMKLLRLAVLMVAAGGLVLSLRLETPVYFEEELVLNGVIIAAFLAALENIIPIKNKIGLMKANLKDYLLNSQTPKNGRSKELAQEIKKEDRAAREKETEKGIVPIDKEPEDDTEAVQKQAAATVVSKMSDEEVEVLRFFLRKYLLE